MSFSSPIGGHPNSFPLIKPQGTPPVAVNCLGAAITTGTSWPEATIAASPWMPDSSVGHATATKPRGGLGSISIHSFSFSRIWNFSYKF
jgi:hypothetical protein